MRGLVETLESTSSSQTHDTYDKQRRLFKALYDVATKYVEVKSRVDGGNEWMLWSTDRQQHANAFTGTASNCYGLGTWNSRGTVGDLEATNTGDILHAMPSHGEADENGTGLADGLIGSATLQNTAFGNVEMEMDLSGAELWDWFNKNQSIMSMLEDT